MEQLYSNPVYNQHLGKREMKKRSCWVSVIYKGWRVFNGQLSIYRAKEELTAISRQFGVKVIFFDRGGPPAEVVVNT
jgi:phosphoenolpyruvate carboxylase